MNKAAPILLFLAAASVVFVAAGTSKKNTPSKSTLTPEARLAAEELGDEFAKHVKMCISEGLVIPDASTTKLAIQSFECSKSFFESLVGLSSFNSEELNKLISATSQTMYEIISALKKTPSEKLIGEATTNAWDALAASAPFVGSALLTIRKARREMGNN